MTAARHGYVTSSSKREPLPVVLSLLLAVLLFPSSASATPGGELWAKLYNSPTDGEDDGRAIEVSPDGKLVFVTGRSVGSGYITAAYRAATGARIWAKTYSGPASNGYALSVVSSPDGSAIFVTGENEGSGGDKDYATVAYHAATGSKLWSKRYDGPAGLNDYGVEAVTNGSVVVVTGISSAPGGLSDYLTIAYDAVTGLKVWSKRYDGPANAADYAEAIALSPDGKTVVITGASWGAGDDYDFATIAYGAQNGAVKWTARRDGAFGGNDTAHDVVVSPDGERVFVTGESMSSGGDNDYLTVAHDMAASGAELWAKRRDWGADTEDYPSEIAVSPDGSAVFVTGTAESGDADYATVAYGSKAGGSLWGKLYDGPAGGDSAYDIAVGPSGKQVYVVGASTGSGTSGDYATLAYRTSTGGRVWASRYDGPDSAYDVGYALVVAPDGEAVYVTGRCGNDLAGKSKDYATIAYSTA